MASIGSEENADQEIGNKHSIPDIFMEMHTWLEMKKYEEEEKLFFAIDVCVCEQITRT